MAAAVRSFFGMLDAIVFNVVARLYNFIFQVLDIEILTNQENLIITIVNRMYILIGIMMLFVISYHIVRYIVDPESLSKSQKNKPGLGGVIGRVFMALIYIIVVPFFFGIAVYGTNMPGNNSLTQIILNSRIIDNVIDPNQTTTGSGDLQVDASDRTGVTEARKLEILQKIIESQKQLETANEMEIGRTCTYRLWRPADSTIAGTGYDWSSNHRDLPEVINFRVRVNAAPGANPVTFNENLNIVVDRFSVNDRRGNSTWPNNGHTLNANAVESRIGKEFFNINFGAKEFECPGQGRTTGTRQDLRVEFRQMPNDNTVLFPRIFRGPVTGGSTSAGIAHGVWNAYYIWTDASAVDSNVEEVSDMIQQGMWPNLSHFEEVNVDYLFVLTNPGDRPQDHVYVREESPGAILAKNVFSAFISFPGDEVRTNSLRALLVDDLPISFIRHVVEIEEIDYMWGISTAVGIFMIILIIGIIIDLVIRLIKLIVLHIISPVFIALSVLGGDEFNTWLKVTLGVYFSVFLRIILLAFISFFFRHFNTVGLADNLVMLILVVIGLLMFLKEAPKFLGNLFGVKETSMGELNPIKRIRTDAVGGGLVLGAAAGVGLGVTKGALGGISGTLKGGLAGAKEGLAKGAAAGPKGAMLGALRGGFTGSATGGTKGAWSGVKSGIQSGRKFGDPDYKPKERKPKPSKPETEPKNEENLKNQSAKTSTPTAPTGLASGISSGTSANYTTPPSTTYTPRSGIPAAPPGDVVGLQSTHSNDSMFDDPASLTNFSDSGSVIQESDTKVSLRDGYEAWRDKRKNND